MKMYSIYSFWKDLISKKSVLKNLSALADFPFDPATFSYIRKGRGFPNFAIKINQDRSVFTGGEFIKLKSRNNYSIAPFKSVIPSGKAKIKALLQNINFNGLPPSQTTDENLLEERDVYFLIRGCKGDHQKICLVHGSLFETINQQELIYRSLIQPLAKNLPVSVETKSLSFVPDLEKASVNFKIKITAEVKAEGNILNSKKYPEILDDTINLVIPYHTEQEKSDVISKFQLVMGQKIMEEIKVFSIKHPLNGWFVVFQTSL